MANTKFDVVSQRECHTHTLAKVWSVCHIFRVCLSNDKLGVALVRYYNGVYDKPALNLV